MPVKVVYITYNALINGMSEELGKPKIYSLSYLLISILQDISRSISSNVIIFIRSLILVTEKALYRKLMEMYFMFYSLQ